jgi:hypothetical protein
LCPACVSRTRTSEAVCVSAGQRAGLVLSLTIGQWTPLGLAFCYSKPESHTVPTPQTEAKPDPATSIDPNHYTATKVQAQTHPNERTHHTLSLNSSQKTHTDMEPKASAIAPHRIAVARTTLSLSKSIAPSHRTAHGQSVQLIEPSLDKFLRRRRSGGWPCTDWHALQGRLRRNRTRSGLRSATCWCGCRR